MSAAISIAACRRYAADTLIAAMFFRTMLMPRPDTSAAAVL